MQQKKLGVDQSFKMGELIEIANVAGVSLLL
jgi:hypothetical protein